MKLLRKLWDTITLPFISVAVMIDESRRINENGDWDEYWRKRNERSMRKEARKEKKNASKGC